MWKPTYATTEDLKRYVRVSDSEDDALMGLALEAASRAIDRQTNRQFGKTDTPEQRRYVTRYDRQLCGWVVDIDDLMTESGLTITVEAGTIDSYELHELNAAQNGQPWTMLVVLRDSAVIPSAHDRVSITAMWGWTQIPDTITQATLLQASRIFSRRQSPYGIAGSPELGSELRLLARVDADVAVMLADYTRWWGAV